MNIAGDSPEMIGGGYSLGILHPPGYPTYTMLSYMISHIPVGSIPFRLNFLSSILHALTLFVLYIVLIKVTRHRAASAIIAAVIGVSPLFWFYSLIAEVFPLNDLLAVSLILVAVMSREAWLEGRHERSRRLLFLLIFLCGLSLTHHHTILLIFPSLLILAALPLLDLLGSLRRVASGVGLFLAGLLPYAYIPIRASQKPYMNFGDPSDLSSFLFFVSRRYYGSSKLWIGPEASHRLDNVFDYLKAADRQMYLLGILLALLGMYAMARKRRGDFYAFFTAFLLAGIGFPLLANVSVTNIFNISTIERFYLLPTIMLAPFVAFGLAETIALIMQNARRLKARKALGSILGVMLVLLLCMPFYLPVRRTYEEVNLRHDLIGESYLENLLQSLEDNAVLFLAGDVPIELVDHYYRQCVKERRNITTIAWSFWGQPWYMEHLRRWHPELDLPDEDTPVALPAERLNYYKTWLLEYFISNNPQFNAYYTIGKIELSGDYKSIPSGFAYRILPASESVDDDQLFQALEDFYGGLDLNIYDYSTFGENRRELWLVQLISSLINDCALYFRQRGELEKALAMSAMAYQAYPFPLYEFQAAEMYAELGNLPEAAALYEDYADWSAYWDPKKWESLSRREEMRMEEGSP
ncbi:MAG: DUF2723 domain-containing protein [Actinomycetota bacterium]|nr:DUF2723 domain-containing protein [Actinomycetota bacterium]